jgi:hypothetical protein
VTAMPTPVQLATAPPAQKSASSGVGDDHQRPLNLRVGKNHDRSRQMAS